MSKTVFGFALTLSLWGAGALLAQAPDRSQDHLMRQAVLALGEDEYGRARELAAPLGPVAEDLLLWMRLRAGDGTPTELIALVDARPHWPDLPRLREETEAALSLEMPPLQVIAFFGEAQPETGKGALALATALSATGQAQKAKEVIATAWQRLTLTDEEHADLLARYPEVLAPLHERRVDRLLWRGKTTAARRMLALLDPGPRQLAEARLALIRKTGAADRLYQAALAEFPDHPGLAYARFKWLADKGRVTQAVALADKFSTSADALGDPFRWSGWRRSLARRLMRAGEAEQAYQLASRHFTDPEDGYNHSDLEWLSGYLALSYLDQPETALKHFEAFRTTVSTPISLGRAWYWIGASLEAAGLTQEAQAAWRKGAEYQTAFYGQLSAEKLGLPLDPALVGGENFPPWAESDALKQDLARATDLLITSKRRGFATLFVRQAPAQMSRQDLGSFGVFLLEREEVNLALLMAKAAAAQGVILPDSYYPLHPLTEQSLPVEPALALAISRQESEFRPDAGSPVGALGLMQLMPGTARDVSRALGMGYSKARLTSDWGYNVALGTAYLADLIGRFGQSPVLVSAGYNAGPGRPIQWMEKRGDPREGAVDPIWWIEHIPFRETRNYVQRVSEAIPIYRARLSGTSGFSELESLLRGAPVKIRPKARPQ